MCVCVCVCVCEREREREIRTNQHTTDRQTDGRTDKQDRAFQIHVMPIYGNLSVNSSNIKILGQVFSEVKRKDFIISFEFLNIFPFYFLCYDN